jgi:hypothetical protein
LGTRRRDCRGARAVNAASLDPSGWRSARVRPAVI